MAGSDSCVLSIDQGTTGSRAAVWDRRGSMLSQCYREITPLCPRPGWVEQDPQEIWQSVTVVVARALADAGVEWRQVAAIGIANQRETTLLWERASGKPLSPAISWQCRRSEGLCARLRDRGLEDWVRDRTGLRLDPYFSATKIQWALDQMPEVRERARRGGIAFGTVDSWLVWNLTARATHTTDVTNASRTLLFNIHSRSWDADLLDLFEIPPSVLPRVSGPGGLLGHTSPQITGGIEVPIAAVVGDQQAALFGQGCWAPGSAKQTYGTGAFLLMNLGGALPRPLPRELLVTHGYGSGGSVGYALEGSIFVAGAALQWLRDNLGILANAEESEAMARRLPDSEGVYFVPALAGLGAPHWRPDARGVVLGLTRRSGRDHLVRAALEAIAYQTRDVVEVMEKVSTLSVSELRVDGGAARNDFLLQFQADILQRPVVRTTEHEATSRGAALLAGMVVGLYDPEEVATPPAEEVRFLPAMTAVRADDLYRGWQRALALV